MKRTVLIMAGGTGGHVFPALAAARVLRERGYEPVWLGTQRGLEAKLVPPQHIEIEWISVSGLRGKGVATWLAAPFKLSLAIWQSLQVMRRRQPNVVLGAGGFVSGPGGVAAWLTRRPLVIHEQNAVAGMTNRLLARLARRVLEAFPASFPPSARAERVGNPVRREIASLAAPAERFGTQKRAAALARIRRQPGRGASQRSRARGARDDRRRVTADRHSSGGERHLAQAQELYAKHGVQADVRAFIDDMAEAYAWADLVVCRSGALTVSELAAAGLPAIFVPFAAAVDDHQTLNAKFLVDTQAAVSIAEAQLTPPRLAEELQKLLRGGRAKLAEMAARARSVAIVDADVRLADACDAVAGGAR